MHQKILLNKQLLLILKYWIIVVHRFIRFNNCEFRVLTFSFLIKDKETQKLKWLEKCIEQLNDNKWVITSLKHIREILQQYQEVR